MAAQEFHLAQFNIARAVAPLDDPIMAEFMARLDEINHIGDLSPGFVWRFQTEAGNATAVNIYDDDRMIINLTVWEDIDALYQFAYFSPHVEVYRKRTDWFEKSSQPKLVLWWIPEGTLPTPEEAKARMEQLQRDGVSPLAFTFKQRYTVEDMLAYTAQPAK